MKRIIFIISILFCSCIQEKAIIYSQEKTGWKFKSGGYCFSAEWDGDCDWYFYIPDSIKVDIPYRQVGQTKYGKFYKNHTYSCYDYPDCLIEECKIIMISDKNGWLFWYDKNDKRFSK